MNPLTPIAALALAATAAHAEPLPLPVGPSGNCPHDFTRSGSFCLPRQGAPDAIFRPAGSSCPWGWLASANACTKSGSGGRR
jgi:hypothetical protein